MLKVLITSSVLIIALLVLRQLFRRTLSRRVQYALWGLVLLRLLVPVNLPAADFSVLSAVQPVEERVMQRISTRPVALPTLPVSPAGQQAAGSDLAPAQAAAGVQPAADSAPAVPQGRTVSVKTLLTAGWLAGSAAAAGFLLYANLRFWRRLRRQRRPYPVEDCPLRVYLVEEGLSSPCLFGLFRPAVYLTPAAVASPERLRHVLAHEQTHARHLDHIWALLRGVCVVIYWFDPLVWLAASASKTDCELACDESVLLRLGEEARVPYGQTLLSLIPVGRTGTPLLAATTMAAGKRQLKDRFCRIAQKPRQMAVTAAAVLLLAGAVTVCAFAGGKTGGGPEESPVDPLSPQSASDADALRALTGDELRFFNEEFFNSGRALDEHGQLAYSILNQFASPLNLYSRPEEIDLYQLFYCEPSRAISDVERQTAFGVGSVQEMVCPGYKLTVDGMDAILLAYTGLDLDQTDRVGLDGFTYLEEYGAYYWMHGDTNYPGELFFPCGTREGNTVRLYQHSPYIPGWYCVTLEAQPDGGYWFRSNLACDRPAVPTPLPASEPEAVISLRDLEPYEAPSLTVEPHVGDFTDTYEDRLENWNIDGRNVVVYRATNGNIYAAVRNGEVMNVFLSEGLNEGYQFSTASGLFGHDGFAVSHYGQTGPHAYGTLVDYFYFDEGDTPVLLARASTWGGLPLILDLDGDGVDELCTESEIFFLRGGVLYRAGLEELTVDADPAMDGWYGSAWNRYAKGLFVNGGGLVGGNEPRSIFRWLYFTGEELLLYRDEKPYHDHMVDGVEQNVPDEVVDAARAYVENEVIEAQPDGTWRHKGWQNEGYPQETYDDWRIERISRSCVPTVGGTAIEGWTFNYELHVVDPENVVLAGGKYFTEDNWVSPGYPNCDWLFFRVEEEGWVFLWHDIINDMSPYSQRFQEYLSENAAQFVDSPDPPPQATAAPAP